MTQTPVYEALLHPPLAALARELIVGLFSGSGDLTRTAPGVGVNAFGLTWGIVSIPSGWGIDYGSPNYYVPRLLQVSAIHRGFDGHDIVSEYHDFAVEGIYWLWANAFPQRIHYEISPGVQLNFWWIVL